MIDSMRLSIIDIHWPGHLPKLASCADRIGIHRLWMTEHHSDYQSASPLVACALVAAATKNVRVGTAGIMLNLYSPMSIAESYKLLELYFNDRIDLGIVSSVPEDPSIAAEFCESQQTMTFAEKSKGLMDLCGFRRNSSVPIAGPRRAGSERTTARGQYWICGTSEQSASLAAEIGANYCFHHYLFGQSRSWKEGPSIVQRYRDCFVASESLQRPNAAIACYGMCAETNAAAESVWRSSFASSKKFKGQALPKASFCGSGRQCADQLLEVAGVYGTNEVVVQSLVEDIDMRLDSYRILSEEIIG